MTTRERQRRAAPTAADPLPADRDVHAGLAAALVLLAWMFTFDRHMAHPYVTALSSAMVALLVMVHPITSGELPRRVLLAGAWLAAMLLVIFTADRAMVPWEERNPQFDAASSIASTALNIAGFRTSVERGLLLLDHPDGLVTVAPSMEKLAIRPLLLLWLAWAGLRMMCVHGRTVVCSTLGLATIILVGMVRYTGLVAAFIEHDEILTLGSGQAAMDLFDSTWITGVFLLIAGVAADRSVTILFRREAGIPRRIRFGTLVPSGIAIALLGGMTGFAWSLMPPGGEKAGRVLIDDRFCGIWEPTARQLDTEWYGDFPTYSFTSLAEWLGKWFQVDVNTSKPYDGELLSRYDVLIIKTPEEPIPDDEAAAIDRFVWAGGGLLLVGDHTNLLGMGTHLNALCAGYGVRFRYDSVSDGLTGGFVDYTGPRFSRHVGALHVDQLEFMTSCSLQVSGAAESVVSAEGCRREPHDYSGSSFFGRRGPHPELAHGRTVLAAVVQVGRGRIAAFTDSTVWSSFAVFSHDREKLAMDLVRLLNRERSSLEKPLRWAATIAAFLAAGTGVFMVGLRMFLPAILFGLIGFWSGVASADALHRNIYAWPAPNAPIPEVAFLWPGSACAFPPVLGTPESLPADRCFDTLLVSVQRVGLVPRVANTYGDLLRPETRAVFTVAPVDAPPTHLLARLKDFVLNGGILIVLDDALIGDHGSAQHFLSPFGVTISSHVPQGLSRSQKPHVHLGGGMASIKVPDANAFVATKCFGEGQIVYMSDAADFSREGMGHCFSRPWKQARVRYETIYTLFRDLLRIAPANRRFYRIL